MLLLILAGLIAAPSAPALPAGDEPAPQSRPGWQVDCPDYPRVVPAEGTGKAEAKKLTELPPGDLILSVYRSEDGCPRPVIVGQGYGAVEAPEAPPAATPPEAPRFRARRW